MCGCWAGLRCGYHQELHDIRSIEQQTIHDTARDITLSDEAWLNLLHIAEDDDLDLLLGDVA